MTRARLTRTLLFLAVFCTSISLQAQVTVKGDVFGAGRGVANVEGDRDKARVSGNATVTLQAGHVHGNVYGGGEMASVGGAFTSEGDLSNKSTTSGNTKVTISGTAQVGDLAAEVGASASERRVGRTLNDKGFVFGAGKGKVDSDSWLDKFAYVDSTSVIISGGRVAASVFGGGENGRVRLGTTVAVNDGVVGRELGDASTYDGSPVDSIEHHEINGQGAREIYFGNVYGGGRGIDTYGSGTFNPTAGKVYRNTSVSISGGRVTHNVYGGGSLASVGSANVAKTGTATVSITGGIIGYTDGKTTFTAAGAYSYDGTAYGSLSAENQQKVKDFYLRAGINEGRVYGGGRGQVGTNNQLKDLAFVNNTVVTINTDAQVRGAVFGGGANGHVRQNTDVTIGGNAFVGIPLMNAVDWGMDTWNVSPDGYVSHDTLATGKTLSQTYYDNESNFNGAHLHERWVSTDGTGPTIYRGNVYGGGRGISPVDTKSSTDIATYEYSATAGRVYGNVNLTIEGGTIFDDVYGGGSLASVGNQVASISGGDAFGLWGNSFPLNGFVDSVANNATDMKDSVLTRYTRDYVAGDPITGTGSITINITAGTIGTDGINNGFLYGGGRGVAGMSHNDYVDVTNLAYANNTYVNIQGGTIKGSAFGGGANGHVWQNTYVRMSGGTVGVRLPLAERKVDDSTGHGYRVYRGNLYGGGRGVDPVHDGVNTHLSNTAGRVYGNTRVLITGGQVYHSVYGGGSLASVGTYVLHNLGDAANPNKKHYYVQGTGQATVTLKGDAWVGHKSTDMEQAASAYDANEITTAIKLGGISQSTYDAYDDAEKKQFLTEMNYHYLGANSAMVFGSGRGVGALSQGTLNLDYSEAAFTHNTIVTLINNAMVCGSVFGGGENGHVKHNTFVNIQGGKVGGIPLHDREYKPYSDGFSTDNTLTLRLEYEDVEDESGMGPSVYRGNVYGGGRGVDHSDLTASTKGYSPSAGRVYGNTSVLVSGGTIYHHVFGGGSLASVGTYDTNAFGQPTKMLNIFCLRVGHTATFTDGAALPSMTSTDTVQYATGITEVIIRGGVIGRMGWNEGSVFGGGRGIAGKNTAQVTHLAYVDRTNVNIQPGAAIMGCVFGGGANGHVLDSTMVTISGGIVGHPLEEADTLTTIYGYAPRTVFRGNVYGGGRGVDPIGVNRLSRSAGRVYGNTHVLMTGGWVRHSLFGGGSMASVGTYDTVTTDGTYDGFELKTGDVKGLAASKKPDSCGRAWVEITGGIVGSMYKGYTYSDGGSYSDEMKTGQGGEGRNNGRVFGSCRGTAGEGYDHLAYVNITRVIIGKESDHTGPVIKGCVFGSGENGHVLDSTLVQMHGGEIGRGKVYDWKRTYIGNLYGGGRGIDLDHNNTLSSTAGWVRNSTHVEMTGGHVWHNVYGGGSLASVGPLTDTPGYTTYYDTANRKGRTWVEISGGLVGRDGLYGGNVFGSGRGRAGENIDTVFHLCATECTYVPDVASAAGTPVTINSTSYGTRTLRNKANTADSLYLAVIPSKVAPSSDSIYYVLTAMADNSVLTVTHDFSERTNIHNAKVIINYASNDTVGAGIRGSVYGSGDNGHVLNTATVAVKGGTIGNRMTFATTAARNNYIAKYPVADTADISANIASNGMVLTAGSVFGSGRGLDLDNVSDRMSPTAGRVYGHTVVNVSGGHVMRNVYGGGNMAGVGQGTTDGSANREITSFIAATGTATVNINGGTIGEVYSIASTGAQRGQWGGNVFGSSRGLSANDTLVKNMAFVRETHVDINNGTVYGSVFGGGENGHVWHNTYVAINGGTIGYAEVASIAEPVYPGNVYGGGRGIDLTDANHVSRTSGAVYGNTHVVMRGGTVYHNVFGGGSLASVGRYIFNDGSIATSPDDSVLRAAVAADFEAGGPYAGITPGIDSCWGKSYVTILGGTIGTDGSNNGRVFGAGRGIAGQDRTGNSFNYYTFVDQTRVVIDSMAQVNGCVFGSGDNGHVSGNTVVYVQQTHGKTDGHPFIGNGNGGPVNGNVFGSGRGADRGYSSADSYANPYYYSATAGRVRGNTEVNILGGTIKNNVYGGGFMAGVLGNTVVNIGTETGIPTNFAIWGDVFGGSALGTIGTDGHTTTVNILSGTIGSATDGSAAGYNAGNKGNIFGGGNGDAGASGNLEAVTLYEDGTNTLDTDSKRDANVLNTVQVNIGAASQYGQPAVGATIRGNVFGCNNIAGSPKGNVKVDVYSTAHEAGDGISSGNVYPSTLKNQHDDGEAGTAGDVLDTLDIQALTAAEQTSLRADARFALADVYGGGNKADYIPTLATYSTTVTIHECSENTIQHVYGGGRAADIGTVAIPASTTVHIEGGHIKQVFAGGDGHTQDGGGNFLPANILGDASVTIEGGLIEQAFGGSNTTGMVHGTASVNFEPVNTCDLLLDEAFGGGNQAAGGSTVVTIPCGFKGSKTIYGGANQAPINGDVTLNIEGGELTRVFGGSKSAPISGNVTVNVYGGSIDELFGGNDVSGNINGKIEVNVDWGLNSCPDDTRLRYVYGGGYQAPYTPTLTGYGPVTDKDATITNFTPVVNIIQATVDTAVFGGGFGTDTTTTEDAHIDANPMVVIGAYRVKDHAGNTIDPQPNNPVRIGRAKNELGRTLAGNVFGGGNAGPVNGSPKVVIQGSDTKVWHNVYGGGNAAMVKGNPDIEIGGNVLLSVPKVSQSGSTVTLTSREGATIYYTTDGSDPTTSATRHTYSDPLTELTNGTVVKAIAHKDGFAGPTKTSGVVTYTVTE